MTRRITLPVLNGSIFCQPVSTNIYEQQQESAAEGGNLQHGAPCLIHQPSYSMLNRWVEDELLDKLEREGIGCIAFSPLAQGMLTDKYLDGIPEESRAGK